MMDKPGCIYLVGTGPGDTNLITVKGLALVREADAIVADTLAHAQLLQAARPEAEIYDTGSRRRKAKMAQADVNQLLLDLAQQGKTVVRLWAGDPMVFSQAALELKAARQAGLRCELVPGVTSAIAAPAYAGVPVTNWTYGSSFAVVSGFEFEEQPVKANWNALAGIETVVILMPLERLPDIVERLLAAGKPADTPALVVENGTLPQQKQLVTTLGGLVPAIEQHNLESNTVVVIGQVVELTADLAWFYPGADYPLLGQRVLVTRPANQAADFMVALRALGAEPVSFPTIEIRSMADSRPLDEAIQRLARPTGYPNQPTNQLTNQPPYYHWLVLTSANGVAAFWERLEQLGLDSRSLAAVRVGAIGPATAAALTQRSIKSDLLPDVYTAEGVLAAFDRLGPVSGQRFLLARADIARRTLAEGLVKRGALVDEIPAYRTVPIEGGTLPPAADIVTFTSSSTVQGYVNCLGGRAPAEFLKHSQVVCIGPVTAATAAELGVPVNAVAEKYTINGILETLKEVCR